MEILKSTGAEIILNNNMLQLKICAEIIKVTDDEKFITKILSKEEIITGLFQEIILKPKTTLSVAHTTDVKEIVSNYETGMYKTKTIYIRALSGAGLSRIEIANLTGFVYQQIRGALISINK